MTGAVAPRSDRILYGRRRHGHRLRKGRLALLETVLPRLALALPQEGDEIGDPAGLFGFAPRETWLEIGFGAGEHLALQAQVHADVGFIGCEPYINGVASLLDRVAGLGLDNVRILTDDAGLLIRALPDACLGRVLPVVSRSVAEAQASQAPLRSEGQPRSAGAGHDGWGRVSLRYRSRRLLPLDAGARARSSGVRLARAPARGLAHAPSGLAGHALRVAHAGQGPAQHLSRLLPPPTRCARREKP